MVYIWVTGAVSVVVMISDVTVRYVNITILDLFVLCITVDEYDVPYGNGGVIVFHSDTY